MRKSTFKKAIGVTAGLFMAASVVGPIAPMVTANAASITINDTNSGYGYDAYQIFAGDYYNTVLSNITWGAGVDSDQTTALLTELNTTFSWSAASAQDVANKLASATNDSETAQKFASIVAKYLSSTKTALTSSGSAYSAASVDEGYYLIQTSTVPTGGAKTRFIMQVAGDATATPKTALASVDKKVWEDRSGSGWQITADAEKGQQVTFRLIAELPSGTEFDSYEKYYINFKDSLKETSFTSVENVKAFKVTSTASASNLDQKLSALTILPSGVTEITAAENVFSSSTSKLSDMSFTFNDVKASPISAGKGDRIIVEYTATVAAGAEVSPTTPNDNEVVLEYSNNPNKTYDTSTGPDSGDKGTTPEKVVRVLTYELDGTKVDSADSSVKLANAEFVLMNEAKNKYAVLDVNNNVSSWTAEQASATKITSNASGEFKVVGLDEGTYYLKETKAPSGYNLPADPFEITITSILKEDAYAADELALESLKISLDGAAEADGSEGIVSATIKNGKGSTLPTTGGMGTMIFFAGGAILVLGSSILLITKRRMRNAEK